VERWIMKIDTTENNLVEKGEVSGEE